MDASFSVQKQFQTHFPYPYSMALLIRAYYIKGAITFILLEQWNMFLKNSGGEGG